MEKHQNEFYRCSFASVTNQINFCPGCGKKPDAAICKSFGYNPITGAKLFYFRCRDARCEYRHPCNAFGHDEKIIAHINKGLFSREVVKKSCVRCGITTEEPVDEGW